MPGGVGTSQRTQSLSPQMSNWVLTYLLPVDTVLNKLTKPKLSPSNKHHSALTTHANWPTVMTSEALSLSPESLQHWWS